MEEKKKERKDFPLRSKNIDFRHANPSLCSEDKETIAIGLGGQSPRECHTVVSFLKKCLQYEKVRASALVIEIF